MRPIKLQLLSALFTTCLTFPSCKIQIADSNDLSPCGRSLLSTAAKSSPAVTSRNSYLVRKRIIGGEPTTSLYWPWIVLITKRNSDGVQAPICAGSLIDDRYVLTAAHCVTRGNLAMSDEYFGSGRISLKIGSSALMPSLVKDSLEEIPEENIIVHGNFVRERTDTPYYSPAKNDIALIRLSSRLQLSSMVRPVCLPRPMEESASCRTDCYTAGWGLLDENSRLAASRLRQVSMSIFPTRQCNDSAWYDGLIDERMVCAGDEKGTRDTCKGDSGGPLICPGEDGQWVLTGITSWGLDCGRPKKPTVFTSVLPYLAWINNITKNYNP